MLPGTLPRVGRRAILAAGPTHCAGVCTFAEDPNRPAPEARVIWDANVDRETLCVDALPLGVDDADRFDLDRFTRWLTVVTDEEGREHAVLSDGYRRIRIDIGTGSLLAGDPVILRYRIEETLDRGTDARLLPLRRLAGLFRTGRFLPALFPREHRVERLIDVLRVHDALSAGASQRDIATGLFGPERIPADWRAASDSLRSRVRRLVRDARHMAAGGYRGLLRR
ncbi:DUF2285 domain-containing protein [Sphingomonas koreensis]|jgi:hypothetical protein|uniref:DUF2285 domain-containing protein n=1 Tax=Sphingomonas koreensis TaxID=93064 RepID=A0AAJ4VBU5_9SPHN|nr:DUF2285 domain-containing protein [Sphingomonas koreensis]RSU24990.1 DUF2285 domain-containing protein [Sphingomonas koreensis]RSU27026.1 DUF2285 domain-containing protein [Sphingomonas koreensis]RSU32861.1 DUF2285 domain-containing protein [Sphingomonas koreensis]RSU40740.1 DUF2285 domain-containing protein [Sphingomonas koreensis]